MKRKKIPKDLRKLLFEIYEFQCSLCGEYDKRKLQIHHLDQNPSNNSVENLRLVCVECHAFVYHPEKASEMLEWYEGRFERE